MAQSLTYTSLLSDLQNYLERTDANTLAQIPRAIFYAESSLSNRLKILGVQNAGNFSLIGGNNALQKPARWRRTKTMTIQVANQNQPVFLRDLAYCLNYSSGTPTGPPKYYADLDFSTWFFSPTPDLSYSAFATWYERPMPLDNSNQQNWFTDNSPTLLLFETLMQMLPYVKRDDRLTVIKGLADEEMTSLQNENKLLIADRTAIAPDD